MTKPPITDGRAAPARQPTLRQLRGFKEVARHASFSRAAEALSLSQPALSAAIRELETLMGVALFERSTHHVRLTPAGHAARAQIEWLLNSYTQGAEDLQRLLDTQAATVRIGCIPSTMHLLAPVVAQWRLRHPEIVLILSDHLNDELMAALRMLVTAPADLTSVDAFVASAHPLAAVVRRRLVDTLDRFGIAHAVLAIGGGADTAAVQALLRRLSHVDAVVAQLNAAAAPVRYRRVCAAITELRTLATRSTGRQIADFLASDATVLAVMGAAVDVVEADGMRVDRADDPAAHRRRAVYWRRYGAGPVGAMHRSCAADICRGSLVLYGRRR